MPTDKQIQANRRNAQLSTGPNTPEGKVKSSLNAVKTGLSGRTVLLPSDDAELYTAHVEPVFKKYAPVGHDEMRIAQSIADTEWRIDRIPALEMGIFALGHIKFGADFTHEDESVRSQAIHAQAYVTYQKQLDNLHLQHERLTRQLEREVVALANLKKQREKLHNQTVMEACALLTLAESKNEKIELADFGFEFTEAYLDVEGEAEEIRKLGYPAKTAWQWATRRK